MIQFFWLNLNQTIVIIINNLFLTCAQLVQFPTENNNIFNKWTFIIISCLFYSYILIYDMKVFDSFSHSYQR